MSPQVVVRVITVSSILTFASALGFAQATGTTPTKPTTGTVPTTGVGTGSTGSIPSTLNTNTTNTNKTSPTYNTPIYLTGRVVLEDGSPLPGPATIERVCYGNAHAEGYTDSQGSFGIELGNESGVFQDASEDSPHSSFPGSSPSSAGGLTSTSNGVTTGGMNSTFNKYQNCELRAKLAGYRSQLISLATRRPLEDPNVGTILLHKDGAGETGTTVSANSLAAPKDSRKAYERGLQSLKKNKTDEAVKDFQKAVDLYPAHAEAWYELGKIQAARGQKDAARESFGSAIKSDPKFVNPYLELALFSMQSKNWQELADLTDRAMRLDSFDYPQLFLFNSVANFNLHKFAIAERSIKQAERLDTQHRFADIPRLNGLILALHKDYAGAAEQFRIFLKMSTNPEESATVRAQLAEIERITAQGAVTVQKDK